MVKKVKDKIMKLAHLGPAGTFSDEAAQKYNKPGRYQLLPLTTIYDAIVAVDEGIAECGMVPIENSIEGGVSATLDVLFRAKNVQIIEELDLPIVNNLVALKGTKIKEITDLFSFYQPLGQCANYVRKHLPGANIQSANSTAEAVARVASGAPLGKVYAAIGTKKAARLYNLEIIDDHINDYANTVTRFVVIGHEKTTPSGTDKTSIACTTRADKPGGLYGILGVFAQKGINLTKIESRPSKEALGRYVFFIDMVGHKDVSPVKEALAEVKKILLTMKILGSYPVKGDK